MGRLKHDHDDDDREELNPIDALVATWRGEHPAFDALLKDLAALEKQAAPVIDRSDRTTPWHERDAGASYATDWRCAYLTKGPHFAVNEARRAGWTGKGPLGQRLLALRIGSVPAQCRAMGHKVPPHAVATLTGCQDIGREQIASAWARNEALGPDSQQTEPATDHAMAIVSEVW